MDDKTSGNLPNSTASHMHRREFVARMSSGTFGTYLLMQTEWLQDVVMPRCELASECILGQVPIHIEESFRAVLRWMEDHGWSELLEQVTGEAFDGDRPLERWVAPVTVRTNFNDQPGFEDFGGSQWIAPGDPAMSLLYHALASPHVLLPSNHDVSANYASIKQLDAIENYVYALSSLSRDHLTESNGNVGGYELAVMAYEYRTAMRTPHAKHADLVFSRTGIARIGQEPKCYDSRSRGFTSAPQDTSLARHFATTPARYGLFLIRKVGVKDLAIQSEEGGRWGGDKKRTFLLPVRKVFDGDPLFHGATLRFAESHRNEKLRGLFTFLRDEYNIQPESFDIDRVPFVRNSHSADNETLEGHDSELVTLERTGSSILLASVSAPLVTEAKQDGRRIWFQVPTRWATVAKSNRRYHTFKLMRKGSRDPIGAIMGHLMERVFPNTQVTDLREPRNAPMFANIRYRMAENLLTWEHLGPSMPDFPHVLDGSYKAAAFEDAICHGCVTAHFAKSNETSPEKSSLHPLPLAPAVSLVTAPDLFPWTDVRDLYREFAFDGNDFFVEGGIEDLSGIRMQADTSIFHREEPVNPFMSEGSNGRMAYKAWDTIAAVVSNARKGERLRHPTRKTFHTQSFLPDTSSKVFYPGWDATYGGKHPTLYLTTLGLGSPFAEDMKLCAAANGMWPVASPDAARTFQGALEPLPGIGAPSTSVPLLDEELGYHPSSPASLDYGQSPQTGWDGEHGPFIGDTGAAFTVDFADIVAADYVRNALEDKLDGSVLRSISTEELIARMHALRNAVKAVRGKRVNKAKLWLIGAEKVRTEGNDGLTGSGRMFPKRWALRTDLLRRAERLKAARHEYLFLFVDQPSEREPQCRFGSRLRVERPCIYVVQATEASAAWLQLFPGDISKVLDRPWN
jgi:hypothetical protein